MTLQIGTTVPANGLGTDGDYYLRLTADNGTRYFQGPKASGAWPASYFSAQGPSGPALLNGVGAPGAGLGAVGQGYVDIKTGTTYLKDGNGWSAQGLYALQGATAPVATGVPSRSVIDAGHYWNQGYSANVVGSCNKSVFSLTNNSGIQAFQFKMPYAGTVVAIAGANAGSATGTISANFYKNGSSGTLQSVGSGAGPYGGVLSVPVAYAANDVVQLYVSNTAGGNFQLTAQFTVQWAAST